MLLIEMTLVLVIHVARSCAEIYKWIRGCVHGLAGRLDLTSVWAEIRADALVTNKYMIIRSHDHMIPAILVGIDQGRFV